MFHSHAAELKQQGAIEAAQDPNSTVTSEDAEHKIVNETKKAGGVAYQFDPNASPEDKAAQAAARVQPGFHHEHALKATGVASDADDAPTAGYDLPSPTTAGVFSADSAAKADDKAAANGHAAEDARYSRYRSGWEPRFGNGDPEDDAGPTLLDHQTWVEGKLDDTFFGDWYYNAGVIAFACLSTYLTTLLGGGIFAMFIIGAICATYYRTSLRRVRRNFRDDIRREMALARLESDTESLEWMNSFLVKFWPIFAPPLCESIIASVDQVLSTSTPAFLDSLRLKTFILGTKPPRLEHVKTYPNKEDNIVLMDWKFSFNPNDTADMTARQLKNKINPKVALEVRVGKGVISKGLDVIVEDFAFSGTMRVKMTLQIPYPHVEKAEICFLGKPEIDYVCKPLGGDTFGFDINFIPGLEGFILEQIHANLGPMMYDPHVFPIEIAKILAGNPVDQAIGVVQITLHSGQGLKNTDNFAGAPDPYAIVSINGRDTLGKTKTVSENSNPQWNQTFNIIVTSLKDTLTTTVFDFNEYRKDKQLGVASFALDRLEQETVHENMQLEVMENGKPRGLVMADIRFFPVLEGEKLPDGTMSAVPESNTGIAKFTVEQAKELDGSKSLIGQLNPYAVLLLNKREVQTSQKLKRTNNPIFPNAAKELLITDRKNATLGVVIKDDRGLSADPILGTYQIKLNDMMALTAKGQEWYQLAGTNTGRAKMMLQWKPVGLKGSLGGGGYITPIGVMRFHIVNARGLRNFETIGKSDPYVRILLSGIEKGRTVTHENNLDPDFDEVFYVPVHNDREKIIIEVMDQENLGKDRSLGSVDLSTGGYVHQDESGEYIAHDEKKVLSGTLRLAGKGSPKGTLEYTCSFFPAYNVVDPEEEAKEKEDAEATPKPSIDQPRSERSGTISSLHKPSASQQAAHADMVKMLNDGAKEQVETEEVKKPTAPKLRLTADDVGSYETGLIIYRIVDVDLAHSDCRIEVLMDDQSFPAYKTAKVRTKHSTLNETGDAMVRELDVSRISIRLRTKGSSDKDEDKVYAKVTGQTLDVLKRHLYETWPITLRGEDGRESRVSIQVKYIPIKMQLDPSESINNMGTVRVDVLDAAELPAADRNGFSDPYCKFILNGKQVFKTQTQKKTLHPAWNEFFETPVNSRTAAKFKMEVYDWDRGDKDDLLGTADVNLQLLEPFQAQEIHLGLDGKSGTVRLKLLFKPDYITRTRTMGTSTFSGTFGTPGKVIGAPVKGVGKGAVLVGGGVLRAATFAGRGFRKKRTESGTVVDEPVEDNVAPGSQSHVLNSYPPSSAPKIVADGEAPSTPSHNRQVSNSDHSMLGGVGRSPGGDFGMASITVVSAMGYEGDNISVVIKPQGAKSSKQVHKTDKIKSTAEGSLHWNEQSSSFKVNCPPDTKFSVEVKDVHTFGRDKDLGEGEVGIGNPGEQTVACGSGTVTLRIAYEAGGGQVDGASITPSTSSPAASRWRRTMLGSRGRDSTVGEPAS